MPGKRNRFVYQMYENGELIDEGFSIDLAIKYDVDEYKFYLYWKQKSKLLKKYKIERYEKYPQKRKVNGNELLDNALKITINKLIMFRKCPDGVSLCPKLTGDCSDCMSCWKESLNI